VESAPYRIGFANLSDSQPFAAAVRASLEDAVAPHPDLELIARDNDMDNDRAIAHAQEFAELPVAVAMFYHLDEQYNRSIQQVLMRAGIPTIAIDIPIQLTTYLGADNATAGDLAGVTLAEWVRTHWNGQLDKVLILTDSRLPEFVRQRVTGARDRLAEEVVIERDNVLLVDSESDREVTQRRVRTVLNTWGDQRHIGVIGINDQVVLGALDAAHALGRATQMAAIGHGAAMLDEGFAHPGFIGSVAYYPERYGPLLVDLARRILAGQRVPTRNFVPPAVVSRTTWGDPGTR
jgi:ribose transport system substrate-binding protein